MENSRLHSSWKKEHFVLPLQTRSKRILKTKKLEVKTRLYLHKLIWCDISSEPMFVSDKYLYLFALVKCKIMKSSVDKGHLYRLGVHFKIYTIYQKVGKIFRQKSCS